ncbi:MAG: hypothetical protein ACRDVE_17405 [Actinocrinis sp.]
MNAQSPVTHALSATDPSAPDSPLESVAVFCGNCSCGCPELFLDHAADEEHRVVITDDFGQRVQMSLTQLSALVADVKSGVLDALVA